MIPSEKRLDFHHAEPAGSEEIAVHPLGKRAKILLTSVFGPYGVDDEYGSRRLNPMELYHNQVTRTQGAFSLRMFHRSWGIMLISANIEAPCTVLDFPTLERFVEELRTKQYDVVGITSIIPNQGKVAKMCALIRQYQPDAKIVVGGHIANIPKLAERIDADHVVKGEGVAWFRRYLGEAVDRPIRPSRGRFRHGHAEHGRRGPRPPRRRRRHAHPLGRLPDGLQLLLDLGHVRRQGQFGRLLSDRRRIVRRHAPTRARHASLLFFVMDENFLLHRKRALRLLELMRKHDKAWSLYVFSSANVLRSYTIEQLVGLGVSWVWMGIEGCNSRYVKLQGIDTFELVRELQSHGIRVLGSTIIGLENHTPENIDEAIDYAARHDTDFHQFMLYTPIPGTPLHAELAAKGLMKEAGECDPGDIHGQLIFNYRHPHIPAGMEGEFMIRAFDRDFHRNGPSVVRIVRTTLAGWKRHKNHPDARIRRRSAWEARELATTFSAVVGGVKLYYRNQPEMHAKMSAVLDDLHREFGWKSRLFSALGSRYVLWRIRREEKLLASGWSYEPPTCYERNAACEDAVPARCRVATPSAVPHKPVRAAEPSQLVPLG